ncbi:MAG: hypothetical protein SchgKO_07470 [Schleiferiaceae bacterium]
MVELASILVLSVFAQWLAWKIKVPAILPLIVIGLSLGPLSTFFTPDGSKIFSGDAIFSGDFLFSFVSISVGVILFEGGLTLKFSEIRSQASTVRNILFFGPLFTLLGGGLAAHYIMGLDYTYAFLFGALIIVSGPTVVLPILKNVKPNAKINTILKWEGILIDPIGALVALLVYEFINSGKASDVYTLEAFKEFFITLATGVFIGALGALFLRWSLNKNRLPHYLKNVFALGMVILVFSFSEVLHHEAGLMASTFMGIALANLKVKDLKGILSFKEDISIILISVLFLLLSSRIEVDQMIKLGWPSLGLFAVVILIIRPLVVWTSSIKSDLTWQEKSFISWIAPRGIVAAAVASLFSLQLIATSSTASQAAQAELILPLTFLIIVGTVVIQGSTAKPIARWLGVERDVPKGILLIGAHAGARKLAHILNKNGSPTLLIDTSKSNCEDAEKEGLQVLNENILRDEFLDDFDYSDYGRLISLTPNHDINLIALNLLKEEFSENRVWRLISTNEKKLKDLQPEENVAFMGLMDFDQLNAFGQSEDTIQETPITNKDSFEEFINSKVGIPLFLGEEDGDIKVLDHNSDFQDAKTLYYIKTR